MANQRMITHIRIPEVAGDKKINLFKLCLKTFFSYVLTVDTLKFVYKELQFQGSSSLVLHYWFFYVTNS